MSEPRVTIVMPVFNGENYLREAVDSALSQTYPNIEIILVDDGSTDGTWKICSQYLADHPKKIKLIGFENNCGVAAALNAGIKQMATEAEYFSWLSHDDVYLASKIERQIELLKSRNCLSSAIPSNSNLQTPQDPSTKPVPVVVFGDWTSIDAKSHAFRYTNMGQTVPQAILEKPLYALINGLIHGCSLLISKSLLISESGPFNESLPTTQDYELWSRIFPKATMVFMAGIPPMIKSRVHPKQDSFTRQTKEELNGLWHTILKSVTLPMMQDMYGDVHGSRELFYGYAFGHVRNMGLKECFNWLLDRFRNMEDIKVSVIIPFRDRHDLLRNAISSVLHQTHQNIELILVDDGSQDHFSFPLYYLSGTKCLGIPASGPAAARNKGLEHATGDYIAFLDSDDTWTPNKIRDQLSRMLIDGSDFSYTSYVRVDHTMQPMELVSCFPTPKWPEIFDGCGIATPTVMVKAATLGGMRFPLVDAAEDVILWSKLSEKTPPVGYNQFTTHVRITEKTAAIDTATQARARFNIQLEKRKLKV